MTELSSLRRRAKRLEHKAGINADPNPVREIYLVGVSSASVKTPKSQLFSGIVLSISQDLPRHIRTSRGWRC